MTGHCVQFSMIFKILLKFKTNGLPVGFAISGGTKPVALHVPTLTRFIALPFLTPSQNNVSFRKYVTTENLVTC